jgi:hypothetical protein
MLVAGFRRNGNNGYMCLLHARSRTDQPDVRPASKLPCEWMADCGSQTSGSVRLTERWFVCLVDLEVSGFTGFEHPIGEKGEENYGAFVARGTSVP